MGDIVGAVVILRKDEQSNHWVVCLVLYCKSTGVGLNKVRELQGILQDFSLCRNWL